MIVVSRRVTVCCALACSNVCIVSCRDVLQCLCFVVPWRVALFVLCRALKRSNVCVVSFPDVF